MFAGINCSQLKPEAAVGITSPSTELSVCFSFAQTTGLVSKQEFMSLIHLPPELCGPQQRGKHFWGFLHEVIGSVLTSSPPISCILLPKEDADQEGISLWEDVRLEGTICLGYGAFFPMPKHFLQVPMYSGHQHSQEPILSQSQSTEG